MDGGPSHVDTFDPKPALAEHEGKAIGKEHVSILPKQCGTCLARSPLEIRQRGQSGLPVSELLPHIASIADDLCVVRSLVGQTTASRQQALLMHTGRETGRAASWGSWVSYGLGSDNETFLTTCYSITTGSLTEVLKTLEVLFYQLTTRHDAPCKGTLSTTSSPATH